MEKFELDETMFVIKQLAGVEDLTRGFGAEFQNRADNPETKVTQINASHFRGVLIFSTLKELENCDITHMGELKGAYVIETGQIYTYVGEKWIETSDRPVYVKTIDDLKKLSVTSTFCVVKDLVRGGIFVYNKDRAEEDDGGTVIAGWVRQFYGAANVKWFGVKGDGITDDTIDFQKAIGADVPLFLPAGKYNISETLEFAQYTTLVGETGAVITSQADIPFIKLNSFCSIKNVKFLGKVDLTNQVGVLVDGGASLRAVFKTSILDCEFFNIGGAGYKLINSDGDGHILSNSFFSVSKKGVEVGFQGNGLTMTGCVVDSCAEGVISAGGAFLCVGNQILNNSKGVSLIAGSSGVDSRTIFSACNITGSNVFDVEANSITNKGFLFSSCSIFGKILLLNSSLIYFKNCNLTSTQITFNLSNDNYFDSCICSNILVTNDVGGVKTKNFFVNAITNNVYNGGNVSELNGGYLEVWEDETDFSITNNQATAVTFSKARRSLPYHAEVEDTLFYDEDTQTFDFTQVVLNTNKNSVFANIQICVNDTSNIATQNNLQFYLYRVDDSSEDINTKIDLSKIQAVLLNTGLSLNHNAGLYVFSGEIPRAKYKLVALCKGLSGKKLYKQGTEVQTGRINAPYKARFWGI